MSPDVLTSIQKLMITYNFAVTPANHSNLSRNLKLDSAPTISPIPASNSAPLPINNTNILSSNHKADDNAAIARRRPVSTFSANAEPTGILEEVLWALAELSKPF